MAAPAELQCSPLALQFSAHAGQDAPLRFTLFNPHPSQRIAFKVSSIRMHASRGPRLWRTWADTTGGARAQIKTTASSTYRVWPNCGPLEPGETQRVQILLLGTKVSLLGCSLQFKHYRRDPTPAPRPCQLIARPSALTIPSQRCRSIVPPAAAWRLSTASRARSLPPGSATGRSQALWLQSDRRGTVTAAARWGGFSSAHGAAGRTVPLRSAAYDGHTTARSAESPHRSWLWLCLRPGMKSRVRVAAVAEASLSSAVSCVLDRRRAASLA